MDHIAMYLAFITFVSLVFTFYVTQLVIPVLKGTI